jgi:hypothetical protein
MILYIIEFSEQKINEKKVKNRELFKKLVLTPVVVGDRVQPVQSQTGLVYPYINEDLAGYLRLKLKILEISK